MKNWKTTLVGILAGSYPFITALHEAYISGYFTDLSGGKLWLGLSFILIGVLSKDHNVSGSKQNSFAAPEDIGLPKPR